MRVTVGLVGDPETGTIDDAEWRRAWTEREQVQFDVGSDESLASVVARALEAFGVILPDWASSYAAAYPFVGFHVENAELRVSSSVDVVDDRGQIIWNVYDFDAVPYGQIVASADKGAIAGDPSRLLVVLQPPSGNGILVDWNTLLQAWQIAWEVLERLATVAEIAGGAEIVRRVIQKLRRGHEAVNRQRSRWTQLGGKPHDLARVILQSDWTVRSLSELLGCPEDDATALLEAFGFEEQGGTWSRRDDADAAVLDVVREEIDYAHHMRYEEFEPLLRERLESFVSSGERAPEETNESSFSTSVLEVTGFGFTDQTATFQARLGERHIAATVPLWTLEEASEITRIAEQVVKQQLADLGDAASSGHA